MSIWPLSQPIFISTRFAYQYFVCGKLWGKVGNGYTLGGEYTVSHNLLLVGYCCIIIIALLLLLYPYINCPHIGNDIIYTHFIYIYEYRFRILYVLYRVSTAGSHTNPLYLNEIRHHQWYIIS